MKIDFAIESDYEIKEAKYSTEAFRRRIERSSIWIFGPRSKPTSIANSNQCSGNFYRRRKRRWLR
ncbi:hypothetical protein ABES58_24275 [Paenibacillus lautus]|uniref:hypothetical protein n=1 Tax=Paenibacillus lautus TaxID=1401 RepID=UPI003D2DE3F4